MIEHAARRLDFRKRVRSAAGLLVVAAPIVFGLLTAPPDRALSQVSNRGEVAPSYEVISIKPYKGDGAFMKILSLPDGLSATGVTLQSLVRLGYTVENNQIVFFLFFLMKINKIVFV